MPFNSFYEGKKVLVTGDTGFKSPWLVCWLKQLGADVYGFGLTPTTTPSLFEILCLESRMHHQMIDIRNADKVQDLINDIHPDVVFHLAAQSLVRLSYTIPLETLHTNFLGTANLLNAISNTSYTAMKPCTIVVVTSDKCYANKETYHAYREEDQMGGDDIYSVSKGATELLVSSWRRSFFNMAKDFLPAISMTSCRAGNVIGGGDWSVDRIVPDCVKSLIQNETIRVRNPHSVRPWQHVLEPLSGYLQVGALLGMNRESKGDFFNAWNFGPGRESEKTVGELCDSIVRCWGSGSWELSQDLIAPHEAQFLKLAIEKAMHYLGWRPVWDLEKTVEKTISWYLLAHKCNYDSETMLAATLDQIEQYMSDALLKSLPWMKKI